jgi:type I restriction enzyme, S subunit
MKTAQLKDFCHVVQGGRHKQSGKHFVKNGYPAYGAGGLNGYLPEAEFNRDGIVLSAIGARCGKCFFAEGQWSSLANTQIILPDQKRADAKYLWYQLNDEARWPRHGLAQPFIRPSDVKAHRVVLPPLDEQRRIAAILDKADALRHKRKRALDLIGQGRDSLIEDVLRTSSNGQVETLKGYLEFITTGGRNWSQYYSEKGSRFIRSLDVQMNSISDEDAAYVTPPDNAEARRTRTQEGDVLLTVTGSRIGRVAELPASLSGSYVSQHVAILRLNRERLRPKFLSFFLSSQAGQGQIKKWQYGQTKPGLNFRQIEDFLIPRITIDLQVGLERALERFGLLLGVQDAHGARLENLFSSLQSRAFSVQF